MTVLRSLGVVIVGALLAGCSNLDRLTEIGRPPPLTAIENPVAKPGYKPVTLPMPRPEPATYNPNSLWRNGSRTFFNDQRASRVGDILTVLVSITDRAEFANKTSRTRDTSENVGVDSLAGLESKLKLVLPKADLKALAGLSSKTNTAGEGSVNRKEKLETKIAAVVTQNLPNGNLVIEGRQEVRVNFEVRELIVAGIIRPEDISADNTIPISKIAQARVSYGGRGQLTDVQQPRYGQQVLDVLLPF